MLGGGFGLGLQFFGVAGACLVLAKFVVFDVDCVLLAPAALIVVAFSFVLVIVVFGRLGSLFWLVLLSLLLLIVLILSL